MGEGERREVQGKGRKVLLFKRMKTEWYLFKRNKEYQGFKA